MLSALKEPTRRMSVNTDKSKSLNTIRNRDCFQIWKHQGRFSLWNGKRHCKCKHRMSVRSSWRSFKLKKTRKWKNSLWTSKRKLRLRTIRQISRSRFSRTRARRNSIGKTIWRRAGSFALARPTRSSSWRPSRATSSIHCSPSVLIASTFRHSRASQSALMTSSTQRSEINRQNGEIPNPIYYFWAI